MNRRTLLKGTVALFGATMLPATALSNLSRKAALPTIKGDGVHDDTAGLQAFFDGRPFVADGQIVADAEKARLSRGRFFVSEKIYVRRCDIEYEMEDVTFLYPDNSKFIGEYLLVFEKGKVNG